MGYIADISNWQSWLLQNNAMAQLDDYNITGLIVGCQVPWYAEQQITLAQSLGIPVHMTYAYLTFGFYSADGVSAPVKQAATAVEIAKKYGITHVALDVESDPPYEAAGITVAQRISELHAARDVVVANGLTPVMYTYEPYWKSKMGNTTEFSSDPLWFAWYLDNAGSYSEKRYVNFGGWFQVAIHQWTSTRLVLGNPLDHNTLFVDIFADDEENDPVLKEKVERLEKAVTEVVLALGGAGAINTWNYVDGEATGNSLLLGYSLEQTKLANLYVVVNNLNNAVIDLNARVTAQEDHTHLDCEQRMAFLETALKGILEQISDGLDEELRKLLGTYKVELVPVVGG